MLEKQLKLLKQTLLDYLDKDVDKKLRIVINYIWNKVVYLEKKGGDGLLLLDRNANHWSLINNGVLIDKNGEKILEQRTITLRLYGLDIYITTTLAELCDVTSQVKFPDDLNTEFIKKKGKIC
jgi:hypothetical protein